MFSNVNRKRITAFKVLKFENVLHFSLEKYCGFQKKGVPLQHRNQEVQTFKLLGEIMKELSIDTLMGSLVNYGGDPMLVETEEQAQELLDSIDVLRPITDEDELETAKSQLDLEDHDEVTKVYGFMCDGCASVMCFAGEWEY